MPLSRQNVSINFRQGIDTKSDPKQVQPGKFTSLVNAIFFETGEVKKRNGFQPLATNASITAGNVIAAFKNELTVGDGSNIYSYTAVNSNEVNKGTKVAVDLSVNPIVRSSFSQNNPDSASMSGLEVYAWTDSSSGVRYSVLDSETDAELVNNALILTTASKVKVRTIGSNFVILFVDGVALKYVAINTATPTVLSAPVTIDATTTGTYDAQTISTKLFVSYGDGAGNTKIRFLDSALVLSAATTIAGEASTFQCVFGDTSNNVWVVYTTGTHVKYFIRSFTLTLVLAPTVIETINTIINVTGIFTAGVGNFFYEQSSLNTYDHLVRKNTGSLVGVVGTPSDLLRSVGLITKPFIFNSVIYVGVVFDSTLQPTTFVINSLGTVICKIAPANSGGVSLSGLLSEITIVSSDEFQFPYILKDTLNAVSGDVFSQTGVSNALLTFGEPIKNDYLGNNLHYSGGILSMYDGAKVVEHSFNVYPENLTGMTTTSAGGLSVGEYAYKATYEWMDNQGQIHRSAPSPVLTEDFSVSTFFFTGDTTNLSTDITNINIIDNLSAGMAVTGAGIPANTVINFILSATSVRLSNAATATATGVSFSATSAYTFQASTTAGSKTLLAEGTQFLGAFRADTVNGSPIITVWNPAQLKVGYTLSDTTFGAISGRITAISGNQFTLNANASATVTGANCTASIFSGTVLSTTNGSPIVTGVPAFLQPLLYVGQNVYDATGIGPFPAGAKIITVGSGTFTMDMNATATVVGTASARFGVPESDLLYVGQTITSADLSPPTIPVGTTIESLGPHNVFTISNPATKNNTSITLTVTQVNAVRIVVPTLRITEKTGNNIVYIVLYRTLSNGTVFFRTSSITALTYNSTTTDSVVFYDVNPDEVIIGNDQLYTTGGELENIAAPALSTTAIYKSRMFGVTEEDPLLLWFSKQVISGTPVEFSDAFTVRVNEKDGGVLALSQMDDKLIIFKHSTVYYMVGDGPAPNGTSNDFSDPLLINSDTGCINKKSVVIVPNGVMFQSTKGIYLIDRSLQVSYIGSDAEEFNEDSVTSARLIESFNQVRFTLSTGIILVYDYFFDQWSTFSNVNANDSTIFQGLYTYVTPAGGIFQETPGVYLDDTSAVLMSFTTGWFSFAGIQGFERVYKLMFLGDWYSAHNLIVNLAYDFVPAPTQTTIVPALIEPETAYQFRVFFTRQKCESFQVTFQESQTSPFGQGLDFSALSFEVGVKKGLDKLPAVQSYGN